MDGRTLSLPVDSASTSGEICQALAKKVQLSDTFGFSLYVSMYEKVTTSPDDFFTVSFGPVSQVFTAVVFPQPPASPPPCRSGLWAAAGST